MARPGLAGLFLVSLPLSLAACAPTVGTACDDARARDLVYDGSGSPAYAGQSIFITSCAGGGSFCHAASAMSRYGAPSGMDFDVTLADHVANEADGARHLFIAQLNTHHLRDDIFGQVVGGAMPPGAVGHSVQLSAYTHDDTAHTPVPDVRSADGREVLRNWLACGSPVVEATTDPMPIPCTHDSDCTITHRCDTPHGECFGVGAIEPVLGGVVTPHWSSIYSGIISMQCTQGPCHSASGAAGAGMLDLSTAAGAYAALVTHLAAGSSCADGTRVRVDPGHPATSLLLQKISGTPPCGGAMPVGTMGLPMAQQQIISSWIMAGALND